MESSKFKIIAYEDKYRDDLIFMILEAKNALGRVPGLNSDLLDIKKNYMENGDMFWLAVDENDRVIGSVGYFSIGGTDEVWLHVQNRIREENEMFLYHYYDREVGPFRNLSDLSVDAATDLLDTIRREKPNTMCAKRQKSYVQDRLYYEKILREEFIRKGGQVVRKAPHYMVVESSPWLSSWYDNMAYIKILIEEFNVHTLSFTYGDSHPTFSSRVNDSKEYRKKLYTYEEILDIIAKYGLPQDWNDDGKYGPERYIEVHIWSDETINDYIC